MPKQLPYGAPVPGAVKTVGHTAPKKAGGSAATADSQVKRPTDPKSSNPLDIPHVAWHAEWMCDDSVGEGPARPCVIHRPSRHPMRHWPVRLGENTLVERQCEHGKWHPDPDAAQHFQSVGNLKVLVHECDFCCADDGMWAGAEDYAPWEDATWD